MDTEGTDWIDPVRICTVQPSMELGNIDANLGSALALMERAGEEGQVDLFILPEVFTTGFAYDLLPDLVSRTPEIVEILSENAADLGSHVMFTQVVKEEESYFNRCFALGNDGRKITTYDKTHLFSRADEHTFFDPGSETTSFMINGATISPLICYELRFPELSRKLVLEGAHILVYMGQWPLFRIFQWNALLLSRAIENQCYVIASGAWGPHGRQMMGGHSQIISPFGNVLGDVGEKEGYLTRDITPDEMNKFRSRIPVLVERRPDLY